MSTLVEIEDAIAKLPDDQFQVLLRHMKERDAESWDQQIENDAHNGRLDSLYARLTGESGAEPKVSLDEFLDDTKFS